VSEKEVDLKASLKEFGQIYPIIKSQFGIIDGFHRELAGCKEVKHIEVKDRIAHYALRFQLNQPDKTPEELFEDRRKCVDEIARELQSRDPELKGLRLQEEIGKILGIAPRTVRKYLSDEFKRAYSERVTKEATEEDSTLINKNVLKGEEEPSGGMLDIDKKVIFGKGVPKQETKAKYADERDKTYLALARHFPEQKKILREILRNTKPYLKTKDDIDRFWLKVQRSKEDPFTIFVKEFYLYDGPGNGWRFAIPWWIRLRLKAIIDKEGDPTMTPERLAIKVLGDYTVEKGITNEETIKLAKEELKREWLID